jgi:hypothetical protein
VRSAVKHTHDNQSIEYRDNFGRQKLDPRFLIWKVLVVVSAAGADGSRFCMLSRTCWGAFCRPGGGVSDQRKGEGERGTPTTDPARQVPSPRPPAYSSAELRPDSNTTTRHHWVAARDPLQHPGASLCHNPYRACFCLPSFLIVQKKLLNCV